MTGISETTVSLVDLGRISSTLGSDTVTLSELLKLIPMIELARRTLMSGQGLDDLAFDLAGYGPADIPDDGPTAAMTALDSYGITEMMCGTIALTSKGVMVANIARALMHNVPDSSANG